ncbi:MAG: hypothetical protein GY754_45210, partial [bacterium]|nr:hypothetical protein [bacterium]
VHSFVGSPENVLERYFFASIEFDCDYIIRVTGDNPFIDVDYGSMALDIALESGADLCSISNLPLGIAIEIIKKEALHETYKMSDKDYHFEHVTTFIKEHSELFHIERHQANFNPPFENLRLTVDTPEDYQLAKTIYEALYQEEPFSLAEVMKFLEKNPKLASINKKVNQRTMYHSSNAR